MKYRVEHIIISLICCLLFISSCSSDETEPGKGDELSFDVSDRARASNAIPFDRFIVFGDKKATESNEPTAAVIFNNTQVVKTSDGWSYSGVQYWIPGHEYSFVAISPVSLIDAALSPSYTQSSLSFNYQLPTTGTDRILDKDNVADIVVATHRRIYNKDSRVSVVAFCFSHAMSMINIAPAFSDNTLSDKDCMQIHKLEFSGVRTKAKFNITPAPMLSGLMTDDRLIDIDAQVDGNFAVEFAEPKEINNSTEIIKNINLFSEGEALIMLPQSFETDSDAQIILSYTISGDDTLKNITLPLNNLKWESGKSYNYKFTLEKTGVNFINCEINPWNPIKGEDISVD